MGLIPAEIVTWTDVNDADDGFGRACQPRPRSCRRQGRGACLQEFTPVQRGSRHDVALLWMLDDAPWRPMVCKHHASYPGKSAQRLPVRVQIGAAGRGRWGVQRMAFDLVLRKACVAGREPRTVDIGLAGGRIAALEPRIE